MNKELLCCYVETNVKPIESRLTYSCSAFNVFPTCIGKGERWNGFTTKLKLYIGFLKENVDKYPFTLGTDSRDVLYYDSDENILSTYKKQYHRHGCKLVFNAETNCFPNKSLAEKHPHQHLKYKYLNSGCFIGETQYIIDTFEKALKYAKLDKVIAKEDDQELMQHIFLDQIAEGDSSIRLDSDCHIFQVLWDENGGRSANFDMIYGSNFAYNQLTKTMPQIFHYPGPTGHGNPIWKRLNSL